jgi:large subunit ribosomal protein L25
MVPAIIYGHGQTPEPVAVSRHDLDLALEHMVHVVKLDIDGRAQQYFIKDVQYDHLQAAPIHVDLMRVDENERVKVKVEIELRGTPKGVKEGGTVLQPLADLEIECLLLKIPEAIRVDISPLEMNQTVHVRELTLPEGVVALHGPDEIVAVVRPPRAEEPVAVAAPVEGAPAEPEVIGKGPKEAEEEEGGAKA